MYVRKGTYIIKAQKAHLISVDVVEAFSNFSLFMSANPGRLTKKTV